MPKVKHEPRFLLVTLLCFILLMLSLINIKNYFSTQTKPEPVLGANVENIDVQEFWNDFLSKNPNYLPGWLEIGQTDKAYFIDPNY